MKFFLVIVVVFCVVLMVVAATPLSGRLKKQLSSSTSATSQEVSVYLVAVGDDGKSGEKIGCGDSLVAVKREIPKTPIKSEKPEGVLQAALTELFSIKEKNYGESGLTNALADSSLTIQRIELSDVAADVYLTGNVSLGGVCDSPRVEEQLKATALQFPPIKTVNFYLNGTTLHEALSEK